jgi:hypothetical protein
VADGGKLGGGLGREGREGILITCRWGMGFRGFGGLGPGVYPKQEIGNGFLGVVEHMFEVQIGRGNNRYIVY